MVQRPEEEVVLLGVRIDQDELDALLATYSTPSGALLPLGGLCAALGIAAQVDAAIGVATVRGRQLLQLDAGAGAGTVRVGSRLLPADSSVVEIHSDEIYVAADRLATWLEIEIRIDPASASIVVHSPWRLPIQDSGERRRRERWLSESGVKTPQYPRVRPIRRLWTAPFLDQTLRITRLDGPARTTRWDYTSYAALELLYLDADARLQGNESHPLAEAIGGIGRRDPDPVLLGPLRAREFRLGEVVSDGLALVTLPMAGAGAMVGSLPLERPSQFDRHVFRGHAPAGWDVELYRDRDLVALRTSPADGAYEFEVPLMFGPNSFRLVFHGPHGERREESRVFYVGPALTPPGRRDYRVVVCQPRNGGARTLAEVDLSLARRLSLAVSAADVELGEGRRAFGAGGLRAAWDRWFATLDVAARGDGGSAVEAGVQTLAGPVGVTLRHAGVSRFRSEVFLGTLGRITSRTTARLDGSISAPGTRVAVQAEAVRDGIAGGRRTWTLSQRASLALGAISASHAIRRTAIEGEGPGVAPETRNSLFVTAQARRWSLRGAVEYDPARAEPLVGLGAIAEGPLFAGSHAAVGLDRDAVGGETRAALNLRRTQGALGWTARTEHGPKSGTSVSLAIQIGLDRDPLTGRWHSHATPVAGRGAASARVFVDHDGDGRRDPTEPAVEGAAFQVGAADRPERTGPDGTVFLSGLPENQVVALGVSAASLQDPLWVAAIPGVSFVPRPGQVAVLDFPVRATGEIVGTVWVRETGSTRAFPGATVELLDMAGTVVASVRTAYDGWYELLGVLPGSYRVRASPPNLTRLRMPESEPRAVTIPIDGAVLTGVDLVLDGRPRNVISGEER